MKKISGNEIIAVDNKQTINNCIFMVRDIQVMLDHDLAKLYGVPTKALNQAVKRNTERFPEGFMFQLTKNVFMSLRSHCDHKKRCFAIQTLCFHRAWHPPHRLI